MERPLRDRGTRTTTKINAHFVPPFFICLLAVNTQNTGLQGPHAGTHALNFPFLLLEFEEV